MHTIIKNAKQGISPHIKYVKELNQVSKINRIKVLAQW